MGSVPVLLTVFVGLTTAGLIPFKTEKELVSYYLQVREPGDSPLLYLDDLPFSARYYSRGKAMEISEDDWKELRQSDGVRRFYVAVPEDWSDREIAALSSSADKVLRNRRYQLLAIDTPVRNLQSASNADGALLNDS